MEQKIFELISTILLQHFLSNEEDSPFQVTQEVFNAKLEQAVSIAQEIVPELMTLLAEREEN